MIEPAHLPSPDHVPVKAVADALRRYLELFEVSRDASMARFELERDGGEAADDADREAAATAIAAGKSIPPPEHRRAHEAKLAEAIRRDEGASLASSANSSG